MVWYITDIQTDAYKLWCWRRLLSPLDFREIKLVNLKRKSTLNIHWKDWCWSWILWPSDVKSLFIGKKSLILRKTEGTRRRGQQKMRWFNSITNSMDMHLSKLRAIVWNREVWHAAIHGVPKSQTQLSYWTTTTTYKLNNYRVTEFIQPNDSQRQELAIFLQLTELTKTTALMNPPAPLEGNTSYFLLSVPNCLIVNWLSLNWIEFTVHYPMHLRFVGAKHILNSDP